MLAGDVPGDVPADVGVGGGAVNFAGLLPELNLLILSIFSDNTCSFKLHCSNVSEADDIIGTRTVRKTLEVR